MTATYAPDARDIDSQTGMALYHSHGLQEALAQLNRYSESEIDSVGSVPAYSCAAEGDSIAVGTWELRRRLLQIRDELDAMIGDGAGW